MSVKLRLRRMGSKKRPIYRLVAIDSRRARNGRFVEQLGHYNPIEQPATFTVNEERVYQWLREGAIPSDTVKTLFGQIGLNEKWEKVRDGKDVSDMELKGTISERKKRTRRVKAAAARAAEEEKKAEAAAAAPAPTPAPEAASAPAPEAAPTETPATEPAAEVEEEKKETTE